MKPEPSPRTNCGWLLCGPWNCGPKRLKNWNSGSSGSIPCGACAEVRWARAVTLMFTTAGPYWSTMPEKSAGVATATGAPEAEAVTGVGAA
ncbi:hypothetical protein D3C85_1386610 [compost metagenome]